MKATDKGGPDDQDRPQMVENYWKLSGCPSTMAGASVSPSMLQTALAES